MRLDCDAVLLDLDGTLVDSAASIERAWSDWAREAGVDLGELLRVMPGRPGQETMLLVAPRLSPAEAVAANDALLARQAADTVDVVALPGAARLVTSLPPGRWAVVTACNRALAEARLRAAGLPRPAVLVTADDVRRGKPDPEGHLLAAARLGVAAHRVVVVEDAPSGVQAAVAAGMRCVAVTTTHRAEDLAGADVVVAGLEELAGLLGELSRPARRAPRPPRSAPRRAPCR